MRCFVPIKSHASFFQFKKRWAAEGGRAVLFAAATVGCLSTERQRVSCSSETHNMHAHEPPGDWKWKEMAEGRGEKKRWEIKPQSLKAGGMPGNWWQKWRCSNKRKGEEELRGIDRCTCRHTEKHKEEAEIITHWSRLSHILPHQAPRPSWRPVRRRRLRHTPGQGCPHWGGHFQCQCLQRQRPRRWRGQSAGALRDPPDGAQQGGGPAGNEGSSQRSAWWAEWGQGTRQWPCAPGCWWWVSRLCVVSCMRSSPEPTPKTKRRNWKKKKKEKKKECKQTHPLSLPPVASLKKVAVVLGGCWWVDKSRWSVDVTTLVYMEFLRLLLRLPVLSSDPDHAVCQPHTHYYLPSRSLLFLYPHTLPTSAPPIWERGSREVGVCVWVSEWGRGKGLERKKGGISWCHCLATER